MDDDNLFYRNHEPPRVVGTRNLSGHCRRYQSKKMAVEASGDHVQARKASETQTAAIGWPLMRLPHNLISR